MGHPETWMIIFGVFFKAVWTSLRRLRLLDSLFNFLLGKSHLPKLLRQQLNSLFHPFFTSYFTSFLQALVPGVGDLVAYVSFSRHVLFVFGFFLRGEVSNFRRIEQETEDFVLKLLRA